MTRDNASAPIATTHDQATPDETMAATGWTSSTAIAATGPTVIAGAWFLTPGMPTSVGTPISTMTDATARTIECDHMAQGVATHAISSTTKRGAEDARGSGARTTPTARGRSAR